MPRRKKTSVEEYTFLALKLSGFDAVIDASINYEVRDPHHYRDESKVYKFGSHLDIEGVNTYPEKREGETNRLTVYGSEPRYDKFTLTLADCHVRDDHGVPKYRKVGGKEVPVYDVVLPDNSYCLIFLTFFGSDGLTATYGWTWTKRAFILPIL